MGVLDANTREALTTLVMAADARLGREIAAAQGEAARLARLTT